MRIMIFICSLAILCLGLVGLFGCASTPHGSPTALGERSNRDTIDGWGSVVDPDRDCSFLSGAGELLISVPGNASHDLAAEIGVTNAPRVLQTVAGDFLIEVMVNGRFAPGRESSIDGRTGYNGAGLVVVADPENVVCLARAVLQYQTGAPRHYVNFEMRSNGKVDGLGDSNQHPLPKNEPVLLRVERRGQKIGGAYSLDGVQWHSLRPKVIPDSWPKKLQVGVVAISTSGEEFNPRFSNLKRW